MQSQADKQRQALLQAKVDAHDSNASAPAPTDAELQELANLKANA